MPVVTIGRQFGAGGSTVGGMLAEELHVDVLESRIIDFDTRKAVLQITQHVIQEAARAGNVVIVGRGGAYLLYDVPGALHVFLGAAKSVRVKAIMERFKIASEEEARKLMDRTDENWTAYIKQVYGHDRNLAGHYDMVLDTGRLGYKTTVEVILAALKKK